MKEKPPHEPEENASVNFKPNTGSTTLWLQLAALWRPVIWRRVNQSLRLHDVAKTLSKTLNQAGSG